MIEGSHFPRGSLLFFGKGVVRLPPSPGQEVGLIRWLCSLTVETENIAFSVRLGQGGGGGCVWAESIAFSFRLGWEGMGLCQPASLHGCKLSFGDVIWGALLCSSCSTLHGGKEGVGAEGWHRLSCTRCLHARWAPITRVQPAVELIITL